MHVIAYRNDYELMALVFRKTYLLLQKGERFSEFDLFRRIVSDYCEMLQQDNPKFSRLKFVTCITDGRC